MACKKMRIAWGRVGDRRCLSLQIHRYDHHGETLKIGNLPTFTSCLELKWEMWMVEWCWKESHHTGMIFGVSHCYWAGAAGILDIWDCGCMIAMLLPSQAQTRANHCQHGGFHSHGGSPIAGWFISWKILPKWMITRGTPIYGNPTCFPMKWTFYLGTLPEMSPPICEQGKAHRKFRRCRFWWSDPGTKKALCSFRLSETGSKWPHLRPPDTDTGHHDFHFHQIKR